MEDMRTLITLAWRQLRRLLRYLGWGGLIVPLAALGLIWFGVNPWTVAAAVAALVVALARPAASSGLLPVAMVAMGVCGLVKASQTTAGGLFEGLQVRASGSNWTFVSTGSTGARLNVPANSKASWWSQLRTSKSGGIYREITRLGPTHLAPGVYAHAVATPTNTNPSDAIGFLYLGRAPWLAQPGGLSGRPVLIGVSLLLLAVGLWLAPRMLAGLRGRVATVGPYLLARLRENYWSLLLVPSVAFGLSVFGVHPWTVALIVAALAITVAWPAVAADLTPAVLIGLAICGYLITVRWQTVSGSHPVQLYGVVLVDTRSLALLAGAEASVLVALAAWLVPRTIGAHAHALAAPDPEIELAGRVERLTQSRNHAIDTATAELMRIERDLHDGAQARLVALGMNLRALERMLPDSPGAALALAAEARQASARALNDLRDLVRGIYPPVLADRGLDDALEALALDTAMPVELDIDLPGRLSAPVESACYFAVAETLANAVKHAGARRVQVRIQHADGVLRIEVSDDGIGGADPAGGTGLLGVERRLGTFDGILAVSSPSGGPTMIAMEVPCALSSPKTYSC
jgi:signal transduction histidine kinase